jgi:hypothetical protein
MRPPAPPPPPPPSMAVRAGAPEVFSGHDATKLRPFVMKCVMAFQANPSAFEYDRTCITFAGSYLEGPALAWFESLMVEDPDRPCLQSWEHFTEELHGAFGDPKAEQTAQQHLLRIRMKPGAKVIDYTTEFRTYAPVSRLGDNALALLYRHGLPERIQRELDREENLHTLAQVQKAAADLDWAYWASRERRERDEGGGGGGSRTSGGQQQQARPQGAPAQPASSGATSGQSGRTATKSKLTDEEKKTQREERRVKDLCFRCGKAGHFRGECPNGQKDRQATAKATFDSSGVVSPISGATVVPPAKIEEVPEEPKNSKAA